MAERAVPSATPGLNMLLVMMGISAAGLGAASKPEAMLCAAVRNEP